MGGVAAERVVAVVAELDTGLFQVGSGYLLNDRQVLTAEHCTRDRATGRAAAGLRVERADGASTPVSVGPASQRCDIAVLEVSPDVPWVADLADRPTAFGRIDRHRSNRLTDVEAAGYPLWQRDEAGTRQGVAELHGEIRVMEGVETCLVIAQAESAGEP